MASSLQDYFLTEAFQQTVLKSLRVGATQGNGFGVAQYDLRSATRFHKTTIHHKRLVAAQKTMLSRFGKHVI
ncbi:MAG: hypothetical protein RSB68_05895, partial [Raoultibacter sp.]